MAPSVVERADDIDVPAPAAAHSVIEPFRFLEGPSETACLLILNQKIERIDLAKLWGRTALRVCADGGANRLYQYFGEEERQKYIPQYITGDLDSLDEHVRTFYERHGAVVIPQYSQYATDFMKAVDVALLYFNGGTKNLLNEPIEPNEGLISLLESCALDISSTITAYVVGGLGGRFDQTIHAINQLLKLGTQHPFLDTFFLTPDDLVFLVKKGTNHIKYPGKTTFSSSRVPICGLLPLSKPVFISSFGLKYDVDAWPSDMAGNVSSSNGVSGKNGFVLDVSDDIVVNIETDALRTH